MSSVWRRIRWAASRRRAIRPPGGACRVVGEVMVRFLVGTVQAAGRGAGEGRRPGLVRLGAGTGSGAVPARASEPGRRPRALGRPAGLAGEPAGGETEQAVAQRQRRTDPFDQAVQTGGSSGVKPESTGGAPDDERGARRRRSGPEARRERGALDTGERCPRAAPPRRRAAADELVRLHAGTDAAACRSRRGSSRACSAGCRGRWTYAWLFRLPGPSRCASRR